MVQAAAPATAAPTAVPPTRDPNAPSPTPRPATATPLPAPKTDRIGYPEDYQNKFKLMYVYDRASNKQVRVICGNDVATTTTQGKPYPFGSVLVMETWRTKQDDKGNVMKDEKGHYIRESLTAIFVMKKEQGFGKEYQGLQTGDWEYVAYRPDKSYQTEPQHSSSCAACHIGSSQSKDWTFRADVLFFKPGRYDAAPVPGTNEISINSMGFFGSTLTVKVGDTVKWTNHDTVPHTVTAKDKSFDSGILMPGESYSRKFETAASIDYFCSLHPEITRGKLDVK